MNRVHELFEAQVARTPDAVAVTFEESRLTYGELNRRADELAQRLSTLGVGPDVLVALHLDRSLEMVVGMLAVLKAGGAYVPLDPAHPRERIARVLAAAEPRVLLTQSALQTKVPPHCTQLIVTEFDPVATARPDSLSPERAGGSHDLAYVIYTSGSTGEPKGVEIEHASVVNMLESVRRRPGLDASDTLLAITTLTFDIAALEIFLPLICGARLVIAPGGAVADGAVLAELLARSGATVLQATPSTLHMLLDAGWAGAPNLKILCGGEAWSTDLAEQLLPRCASLWNMYGPTETTVWSAVRRIEAGQPVVVGGPIANTRLYVLDRAGQLVPIGVAGELHIGGAGLARGYFRRPDLTGERFVADPYDTVPGARMYRTGDLVRRLSDGSLEFLGRMDHQVKIRGHRVELGEIEATIDRHPGVERSVVVARDDEVHGGQRLDAYFLAAPGAAITAAELRAHLGESLPTYMIPSYFVSVSSFPLSPSGKLDRKALPPPDRSAHPSDRGLVEPRTPKEAILARIWCEMLKVERVDVRDNFFDIGGHSLLATRVIGKINQAFETRLSIPAFFENPTIEGLAALLDEKRAAQPEPRLVQPKQGNSGLPLYFVGTGMAETQIAQLLRGQRPVFLVDIPIPVDWIRSLETGDLEGMPTIEEIGALHAEVMRARVGSAPFVVAGYSMWGRIAFETARALQRGGGDVALVLLLDARVRSGRNATLAVILSSLRWIWRNRGEDAASARSRLARFAISIGHTLRLAGLLLKRVPHVVRNRFRAQIGRPSGYLDSKGAPVPQRIIDSFNRVVGASYRPVGLKCPGVLVRVGFVGEKDTLGYDFTNGWADLFDQDLEIIDIAGEHHAMFRKENLDRMAKLINDIIIRYDVEDNKQDDETPTSMMRKLEADQFAARPSLERRTEGAHRA